MYISKPKSPEELYQFFVKGMPLKPVTKPYYHVFKRKGWNVLISQILNGNILKFKTLMSAYYPDWELKVYKYADTETN